MNYERLQSDKKDILIIDDTPDNLRILSWLLTKKGYSVRKAMNYLRTPLKLRARFLTLQLLNFPKTSTKLWVFRKRISIDV
ncbi:hypothetical protein CBP10_07710 [Fischerella thermalis WC558]|nr:hypothetical protein CBP10_07710 [Fischerella thermalis WC558]